MDLTDGRMDWLFNILFVSTSVPRDNKTQDNGNISVIPTDFRGKQSFQHY